MSPLIEIGSSKGVANGRRRIREEREEKTIADDQRESGLFSIDQLDECVKYLADLLIISAIHSKHTLQ